MNILYIAAGAALALSAAFSPRKTAEALKIAARKFWKILPQILIFIIAVSVVLYFVPEDRIAEILEEHGLLAGSAVAAVIGSIAFIPGFIVFPLCGLLREHGVSYTVLSAFTTTLMMVGVLSFGLEKDVLGWKLAAARNISAFILAMLTALVTGLIFGELAA